MDFFIEFFSNRIMIATLLSWFVAQLLKFIIVFATENKVDFHRMIGSGGMPSLHSSSVATLTTCVGRIVGWGSVEFVICFVFAVIVMYDASGVRRAAGQHAAVLNKLIDSWAHHSDEFDNIELKELLGHTPLQVVLGGLLGVIVGLLFKL